MSKDPFERPDLKRYLEHFKAHVAPNILNSAYVVSIAPEAGKTDVKIALEIGLALLADKPLIVIAPAGRHPCERLLRVADHVVHADMTSEKGAKACADALERIMKQ